VPADPLDGRAEEGRSRAVDEHGHGAEPEQYEQHQQGRPWAVALVAPAAGRRLHRRRFRLVAR
jgi:hypothetical protein